MDANCLKLQKTIVLGSFNTLLINIFKKDENLNKKSSN